VTEEKPEGHWGIRGIHPFSEKFGKPSKKF